MRHPDQPSLRLSPMPCRLGSVAAALAGCALLPLVAGAGSRYTPIASEESFSALRARYVDMRPNVERRHRTLLEQRYDPGNKPGEVTMTRG